MRRHPSPRPTSIRTQALPALERLEDRLLLAADVVISEIMYNPFTPGLPGAQTEDVAEEYIELYNRGDASADLTGWRLVNGVDFTFPAVSLDAGAYLAVAADVAAFSAKYPGVTNVVGGWTGRLRNSGEDIELEDSLGTRIDRVGYADEGDWAERIEGPLDLNHTGWVWSDAHDGGGKSLELINPAVTNNSGQNWAASVPDDGTPGAVNSVLAADTAPLIREVEHYPIIPRSTDPVTIRAEITDELTTGLTVTLYHRNDGDPAFTPAVMFDDGLHDDGGAADGLYAATLSPQADGTIVEWYVEATDTAANSRTWPAPVPGHGQVTNLLYQVDDSYDPDVEWVPGSQPLYRVLMTAAEAQELADLGSTSAESHSDAQMNGVFISQDGTDVKARYQVGVRNRGSGSRTGPPQNYRVNFAHDRGWYGVTALNINNRYGWLQTMGSAVWRLAGLAAAESTPIQLRINGQNLAVSGDRMYNSYVAVEALDGDWASNHFPGDPDGNLYRCTDDYGPEPDLGYEGTDPEAYREQYLKQTNQSEDDYTDLISLTWALNNASDATFLDDVAAVVDIDQWLRFLAVDSLIGNREGGLNSPRGDDYALYRGMNDTRFLLVPHDLDTVLGEGDHSPDISRDIWRYEGLDGLTRLLGHPEIAPRYYAQFLDLIDTVFSPAVIDPLLDRLLGGYVPAATITRMKQFVVDRNAAVLAQIPTGALTASSSLPVVGGYPQSAGENFTLSGTGNGSTTLSVLVDGQPASWDARAGTWTYDNQATGPSDMILAGGDEWLYLDDGSDQGSAWKEVLFPAESTWTPGNAQLGYGDGDEATEVSYGGDELNKHITTYFRKTFNVADASLYAGLKVHILRDDGAVIYLNGTELPRSNMPAGTVDYQTLADSNVSGAEEDIFYEISVNPALLEDGPNVLAVEIHQELADSSDISFDLKLEGIQAGVAPTLDPGVNRITVEAYDGLNGTGNLLETTAIDLWYDDGDTDDYPKDPPPPAQQQLMQAVGADVIVRDSYLPGTPVLVRVAALDAEGNVDRDLWDATATLSVDNPAVTLSTNTITMFNGLGSGLVTFTGGGDFTLTVDVNGLQDSHALTDWSAQPVTDVSGSLAAGPVSWSGIVHVTGDVLVPSGTTLTVQPGTLVLVDGVASGSDGADIDVQGEIQSLGTASSPVTFTAYNAAEEWGEIHHDSASPSLYQYTSITLAGHSPGGGHTGTGPMVRPSGSTITFDHVSMTDSAGKVMQSGSGSDLTFRDCHLARSIMGPEVDNTALVFEDNWITEMHGPDDDDGIYIHSQSGGQTVTLTGGVIADTDDDGLDTLHATVFVSDYIFRDVVDKGISVFGGEVTLDHIISANNAFGISTKDTGTGTPQVTIDHATIVGNDVGVAVRDKTNEPNVVTEYFITNSIIWGNRDAVRTNYLLSNVHIDYSIVGPGWWGEMSKADEDNGLFDGVPPAAVTPFPGAANKLDDPLFVLPGLNDYHLQDISPAIDAGDPADPADADLTITDLGFYWHDQGQQQLPEGSLTENTTWTPQGGPYRVIGELTVPFGITLTIEPGTSVFFESNAKLIVEGRLLAEGSESDRIRFTRSPGVSGYWAGIQFENTLQDNRITHAIVEYGRTHNGMIGLTDSNLLIDGVTFDHTDLRRIRSQGSSLIVRNSVFEDIFGPGQAPTTDNRSEHIWGDAHGAAHFILENNHFGTTKGHNDAVDVDGGFRPDPIPQILNNVFAGGGDDALDLETDAHIEGNVFLHIRKDQYNTDPGESNSISAGSGHHFVVVRNVFHDVDHVSLVKEDSFMTFVNNTVSDVAISALYFDLAGQTSGPGDGAYVDGNVFANTATAFTDVLPATILTVNNSIVDAAWHSYGTGNIDAEARLADPAGEDFRLGAGSPAVGTGPWDGDMGYDVPAGAAIGGTPPALTYLTDATFDIGGPGITDFKWRIDGGAWSAETPAGTPVALSGLADGPHTIEAIGRSSAGVWQDEADAASRSWTVDTTLSRVLLNEVLARNVSVDHEGTLPDIIELYNDSADPMDIGGMGITDNRDVPGKFVFQPGTTIPGGGYLVLYADSDLVTTGIHLGFSLDGGNGDDVWLYEPDLTTVADSVTFGVQAPDLSIGRVGRGRTWALNQPTPGQANVNQPAAGPDGLKINEWLASGQIVIVDDFVELYNGEDIPADFSGVYLTDTPESQPLKHQIPPLSFIGAEGFVALDADGSSDSGHLNFNLSSRQELIALTGPAGEEIDQVIFAPQTTDVSQGRKPDGGDELAFFRLPTPAVTNPHTLPGQTTNVNLVDIDQLWAYDDTDTDLGTTWKDLGFDDSLWPTGQGLLYVEGSSLPAPKNTPLTIGATTFYFRTSFFWSGEVDTTPPSAPATVTANPISQSQINLSWTPAEDAESGIGYYFVYRDGQQIDTTLGTAYADAGLAPGTEYSYEIAAVNGFGLEGAKSTPTPATTLPDTVAPTLQAATAVDASTIELTFSETLDAVTAELVGNYTVTDPAAVGVAVTSATLEADGQTVTLALSAALAFDTPYLVAVGNVQDPSGNPVPAGTREEVVLPPNPILLPRGSEWRYLDDGSDQGTAWKEVSFPPADLWASGNAQLGYGDGDEDTLLGYGGDGQNKYITYYFRTTFDVADASRVTGLTAHLLRDDGAVVYLNGEQDFTSNFSTTPFDYLTEADGSVGGGSEDTFYVHTMDPTKLVTGTNVVAVEIHQNSPSSSDISLDLEIVATVQSSRPTGTDDAYTADQDTTLIVGAATGVLDNDSDPAPGPQAMSAVLVDDVAHGQLALLADGSFTYDPAPGYAGPDSFTYRAYDGQGYSNLVTVGITIQPPPPAPGTAAAAATADPTPGLDVSLMQTDGEIIALTATTVLDDGMILYMNGEEIFRWGMDDGVFGHDELANRSVSNAVYEGPFSLPLQHLVAGNNLLAVEVHQTSTGSSDVVFGMTLDATVQLPSQGTEIEALYALFDGLKITEIMYNPVGGSGYEFIEFQNTGTEEIDLTGVRLRGGVEFDFPAMTLAAGEYAVVAGDLADFQSRYGAIPNLVGPFSGNLSNGGEDIRVELPNPYDAAMLRFAYNDVWYPMTDGDGLSLVIHDAASDRGTWGEKNSWRASSVEGGSPGTDDPAPEHPAGSIVVNEILAHSDGGVEDWIELYNTTDGSIDIGGWFLSDDGADLMKYEIAANTIIDPGQYKVFNEVDHFGPFSTDPGRHTAFALSELGDDVILSSGSGGQLGTYRHQVAFDATANSLTVGRHVISTGNVDFTELADPTMGSLNSAPLVGDVVIEQLMYNPDAGGHEYILLRNRTASPVDLFDPAHPTNTWQFTRGVDFIFPQGVTIPAGGYALVTELAPAVFRATYDIPAAVQIFGPFENGTGLAGSGETVELSRPGAPEVQPPPLPDIIPQLLVDVVNYDDDEPWPNDADGDGPALLRLDNTAYGSDPINWTISAAPAVTVDPLTTLDATPPLTGTVDNAMAHVYVTVNGAQYTAVNNGDGTWTLPDDTIGPALADGTYNVQARAVDHVGAVGLDGTLDELTIGGVDPAPTVERVLVGSTSWDATFLAGLGDIGYAVPEGVDQLDELPWVNLDQLMIVFSEPVTAALEDLSLYGVHTPEYTVASFDYDVDTLTATWTLSAPVAAADKLLAVLADTVTDAGGNALDGEWSDGISTYSSGDGQAGGDFSYRLNVLPGDTDQSGEVRSSDVIKVRRKGNTAPGDADYSPLYDVDGSGEIRSSDVIKVRRLGNTALPAGEPTVPPSAPSSLTVEAMLQAAAAAAADSDDETPSTDLDDPLVDVLAATVPLGDIGS